MNKVSIIIPAYNEEKRIGATLETYGKFFNELKKNKKLDYEILVVINNTKDRTEEIVRNCQKINKNIRYLNFIQGGKGFATIEGFKDSLNRPENILAGFVDADMATPPEAFYDLVKNIQRFDGLIASRYIKGAIVKPKQTFSRIFVSRLFNILTRVLFLMNYRDTQCGAKVFKRHALEKVVSKLGMSQWAFDVELLYLLEKYGFKVKEYPTIWADKEYSKINFAKAGPRMALSIIRLRLINSIFEPLLRPLKTLARFGDALLNKK